MEIKRKKITTEEIYAAEQKFAQQITQIWQNKKTAFEALGHELVLEFGQKEDEAQRRFEVFSDEETKTFESGYVSRAMITIRRPKTEEELAEDQSLLEELRELVKECEEEDAGQNENEEAFREDATKHTVAFTGVMLVRAYKSFWTEWISLGDDLDRMEADLDEFLVALEEKCKDTENS